MNEMVKHHEEIEGTECLTEGQIEQNVFFNDNDHESCRNFKATGNNSCRGLNVTGHSSSRAQEIYKSVRFKM